MTDIWEKLVEKYYVREVYNETNKTFVIKIYENDINYLKDNWHKIINPNVQQECFIIACSFSNDTNIIQFIIDKFRIDPNFINKYGNNCLLVACRTASLSTIKYLIEKLKVDVHHVSRSNVSCLQLFVLNNNNVTLEFVKYLIEDCRLNINHEDALGFTCLIDACSKITDVDIIKYLVEQCKANINHTTKYQDNCLTYACYLNRSLDVIKYLVEELKMDITQSDVNDHNCLELACRKNSLEVIKYLIEDRKMNIRNNCLALACKSNNSIAVIDYLVNVHGMNIYGIINNTRCKNMNYLALAFIENALSVIKHLIEKYGMNIPSYDIFYTCFHEICDKNTNIDAIKYLFELYKSNNHDTYKLVLSFTYDTHMHVAKYFLTETDVPIFRVPNQLWVNLVQICGNNYNRFNELLSYGLTNNYDTDVIKQINPLLLNSENRIGVDNPYDYKYIDFKKLVSTLYCIVPIEEKSPKMFPMNYHKYDHTKKDLLFKHNGHNYYGDRTIVYDSIILLKEIKDITNFNEVISLNGTAPKYFMNMWIDTAYNTPFDILEIKSCDLSICLKHIDQYPMKNLTIESLEYDLIKYFEVKSLCLDDYIKDVIEKCQMKSLYLFLHNNNIKL
jgi:ankyrin repeat protein